MVTTPIHNVPRRPWKTPASLARERDSAIGVVLAFVRLWLLSLLMVALIVGIDVVPLLGVALIAAYFVVRQAPEVLVRTEAEPAG